MDDYGISVPNCPGCLEPMQPRAAWWFCQPCQVCADVLGRRYTLPHDVESAAFTQQMYDAQQRGRNERNTQRTAAAAEQTTEQIG